MSVVYRKKDAIMSLGKHIEQAMFCYIFYSIFSYLHPQSYYTLHIKISEQISHIAMIAIYAIWSNLFFLKLMFPGCSLELEYSINYVTLKLYMNIIVCIILFLHLHNIPIDSVRHCVYMLRVRSGILKQQFECISLPWNLIKLSLVILNYIF